MHALLETLLGAPWWVYVLLVYFISIGISARRARKMSFKRLIVLPFVFTIWSLYSLYDKFMPGNLILFVVWILALSLGGYLGAQEVRRWKILVDRKKKELTIPGNLSTLILILLLFAINFFWGYWYASHPAAGFSTYFWNTCTSALVSGFFVGRAWIFFRRYTGRT